MFFSQQQKGMKGNGAAENLVFESLKIVEETYENTSEAVANGSGGKEQVHSPSKASYIHAKQQLLLKQERANSSVKNSPKNVGHVKLSPSKSMTLDASTTPTHVRSNVKQNMSQPELDQIASSGETMPTKDAVIRKMKKITKAVQELFKATKEAEFGL